MTSTTNAYGNEVIEFHLFSEEEFQTLLNKRTHQYNTRSEGLHYKDNAGNVDFLRFAPLELALIELQDVLKEGFTIVKASYETLYFKAILRKPEKTITAELAKLSANTKEEYEASRWERNRAETAQKLEAAIANSRRETEAAAAAVAAKQAVKQAATEKQNAMEVLKAALSQPAQAEVERTGAAA